MKILKWVIGVPVGLFVLFLVVGTLLDGRTSNDPKARARRTIETCWDDQGKKSLDPATARFVAGTCERLESDFMAKYGVRP